MVLAVEKKSVAKLQEERTVRKICLLDDHVVMAFAGMQTDLYMYFCLLFKTPVICLKA